MFQQRCLLLDLLTERLSQTAAGVLQQRIDEVTTELEEARTETVKAKEDGAAAKAKAKDLESQAAKFRKERETRMSAMAEQVKSCKKLCKVAEDELKKQRGKLKHRR